MERYRYDGLFIDNTELLDKLNAVIKREPLEKIINSMHITFEYRPKRIFQDLFGTKVTIKVTGYGNDGSNEGVSVAIGRSVPELDKQAVVIKDYAHITISLSEGAKAVNTRYLSFEPFPSDKVFTIKGKYGAMRMDGSVDIE